MESLLTGPGGPFEVVNETVNGVPMRVYRDRMRSLGELARSGAARGDDQVFVVHRGRRVGFASFVEAADRASWRLVDSWGLRPGDRVAVLSANNLEWCQAFWATVDVGAVLVGLNGWWKADEVLYALRDSRPRVLVADGPRLRRVAHLLGGEDYLEAVFVIGDDPGLEAGGEVRSFDELVAPGPPVPPPDAQVAEDDPAVIFYTSGTTGRPKGAVSTHRSMIANLQNTLYSLVATAMLDPEAGSGAPSGQVTALLTSPLFHVSGCHSGLVVSMAAGLKLVIPDGRFDPEQAMALIEQEKVTVWATVPTMIWRVVEHPRRHDYDLSSVRSVAYGGSPSAAELQRRIQETFPNVAAMSNAYGLTETSSVATVASGREAKERPDSVGRPVPVVEVKVVDERGCDLPARSAGEIWIKGPTVMPGYWNDPEATAEVLTDGWLHTGDVGFLDDEGFLYVTDRAKDVIIRGGENVYCVEIENRLAEHPAVAEAAVVGVPHPTLGEEVKAVVRLEEGRSASAEELRRFVGETLADFKVPSQVAFTREALPRNASGKLLKDVLRGRQAPGLVELL